MGSKDKQKERRKKKNIGVADMLSVFGILIFSGILIYLGHLTSKTSDPHFELSLRNLEQSIENHQLLTKINEKIDKLL
jgi:hypothetical protein